MVRENLEPASAGETEDHQHAPFAVVPILRGRDLLGMIEASRQPGADPIAHDELQTLSSFALQAAVAISDAQTCHHIDTWQDGLDEMVAEVDDLDRLIP